MAQRTRLIPNTSVCLFWGQMVYEPNGLSYQSDNGIAFLLAEVVLQHF